MKAFTHIVLPKATKRPSRESLARTILSMPDLGAHVRLIRTSLHIQQAELAARAKVSRQWLVALEQGRQSLEAGRVLRTLTALGFEIVLTPFDPPPPWMLRAVKAAHMEKTATAERRRMRRNTRRANARLIRVLENNDREVADLE